jgi:hypothetical protein
LPKAPERQPSAASYRQLESLKRFVSHHKRGFQCPTLSWIKPVIPTGTGDTRLPQIAFVDESCKCPATLTLTEVKENCVCGAHFGLSPWAPRVGRQRAAAPNEREAPR